MVIRYRINSKNIFRNYIFYILISIGYIFSDEFVDIKKLYLNNNYFVILDSGLYLYNFNTSDCSIILSFDEGIYRPINNKINLTELNDEYNSFIFCLVNEYLFIFNEHTNKTISYILYDIKKINNDFNYNNNYYYNLMPYKFENNNMSFIIVINKGESYILY